MDYFTNRYPGRITTYPKEFDDNNYGFGFQKNEEGEKLVKEFNEFLSKTDIDALYYKWTHTKTKNLHVDTYLPTNENMNLSQENFYYYYSHYYLNYICPKFEN